MTWAGLVWRNLGRRPARTALTTAGVAVGVALIVALLSISAGVRSSAEDLIHVGRADFGLFQEGAADLTRSVLPASLEARVAASPGVAETARVFLQVTSAEGHDSFLLFGLDPREFAARRLVVVKGRRAHGSELMLGDRSPVQARPGQAIVVAGRRFRVAGLYHTGDRYEDLGAVLPLPLVQRLAQRPGEITTIAVSVEPGHRPGTVARELQRRFPGVTAVVEPGQVVKIDTTGRLIADAGWIFSLLALIIGGIAVTNTMAMSVFERVREIGILRAVGWPARRIGLLILSEALGIGVLALAVGLALGYAAAELFADRGGIATLAAPRFTAGVFAWGLAFALGVAAVGAVYPVWRATRLTPIEALRHE